MVIARESTYGIASAVGLSSVTMAYPLALGSENDRLVVIGVCYEEDTVPTRQVTSVTFNGVSMIQISDAPISFPETGIIMYVDLYYILDASLPTTSGSYNVIVTLDGVVANDEVYVTGVEYSGVFQEGPDDSSSHFNLASGATSVTLTPAKSDSVGVLVMGCGGFENNPVGRENNITSLLAGTGVSSAVAMGELVNQSTTFTFGYNDMSTREGCIGAVWKPSTAEVQTHQNLL
jgi:hypothetical protein